MSRSLWTILALGALVLLASLGLRRLLLRDLIPDGAEHPLVGARWEQCELSLLATPDSPITLESLRGHVVLVNFWATWCGPCRQEFPGLSKVAEQLRESPQFELVSVCCDDEPPQQLLATARQFLAGLQVPERSLRLAYDLQGSTREALTRQLEQPSFALPTTLLLDGDGVIRAVWVGYLPGGERDIEAQTRRVLAGSE